jgi:hypothetical protein
MRDFEFYFEAHHADFEVDASMAPAISSLFAVGGSEVNELAEFVKQDRGYRRLATLISRAEKPALRPDCHYQSIGEAYFASRGVWPQNFTQAVAVNQNVITLDGSEAVLWGGQNTGYRLALRLGGWSLVANYEADSGPFFYFHSQPLAPDDAGALFHRKWCAFNNLILGEAELGARKRLGPRSRRIRLHTICLTRSYLRHIGLAGQPSRKMRLRLLNHFFFSRSDEDDVASPFFGVEVHNPRYSIRKKYHESAEAFGPVGKVAAAEPRQQTTQEIVCGFSRRRDNNSGRKLRSQGNTYSRRSRARMAYAGSGLRSRNIACMRLRNWRRCPH